VSGRAWPAQKLMFLEKMAFLRIFLFKTLSSQYTPDLKKSFGIAGFAPVCTGAQYPPHG
jgi:hypothetical protein